MTNILLTFKESVYPEILIVALSFPKYFIRIVVFLMFGRIIAHKKALQILQGF